eukprot:COSAG02_NODE_14543_length_1261_cov_0.817556_1_plen_126_part_00
MQAIDATHTASADGLDGAGGSVASGGSGEPPILVISDPHGNLSLVREALERGVHEAGRMDLTVVLIGDYCDNGPELPALLDFLCDVHDNGGVVALTVLKLELSLCVQGPLVCPMKILLSVCRRPK